MSASKDDFELIVVRFDGNPAHCVYLNNSRIAGSKPWGGGETQARWAFSLRDLQQAFPDLDITRRKISRQEAGQ